MPRAWTCCTGVITPRPWPRARATRASSAAASSSTATRSSSPTGDSANPTASPSPPAATRTSTTGLAIRPTPSSSPKAGSAGPAGPPPTGRARSRSARPTRRRSGEKTADITCSPAICHLQEFGRQQNLPEYQGDTLYLFVSDDLANWTYLHKFYESRREWTRESEDDMCPDFFPLPASPEGGPDSGKHMILFISHNMGCQYYIGEYADDRFAPESHGRMTWVDNEFFAPESVVDPAGRRIMWTWVFDRRSGEERAAAGWSGEMSLPRLLWLGPDNTLRMRPVPELERLRYNARTLTGLAVPADGQLTLPIRGDSLELSLEFRPGLTAPCGLKVRQSPDGEEETVITYDPAEGALKINTQKSCRNLSYKMIESAPLSLAPGEPLQLRVFLDKSFVEVFANDRQAVVRRIYPSRPDSQGISLFASGGPATVTRLDAWDMMPSNPY
ncbi:MAG: GH32 C-terminal domain-containing protein [Planctomycetota bacterium]